MADETPAVDPTAAPASDPGVATESPDPAGQSVESPAQADPAVQPEAPAPSDAPASVPSSQTPQEPAVTDPAESQGPPAAGTEIPPGTDAPPPQPSSPTPEQPPVAPPVQVHNLTRRSDDDGIEGGWVVIVDGEYKGIRGSFAQVVTYDPQTGYPETILVKNRDFASETGAVVVDYNDVRPAWDYHGGR